MPIGQLVDLVDPGVCVLQQTISRAAAGAVNSLAWSSTASNPGIAWAVVVVTRRDVVPQLCLPE